MRDRKIIEQEVNAILDSKIDLTDIKEKIVQTRKTNRIKIEVLLDTREAICNLIKSVDVMNQNLLQIKDIAAEKKPSILQKLFKKS